VTRLLGLGLRVALQGNHRDPDKNRWELCWRVLVRKDVVEKLSEAWYAGVRGAVARAFPVHHHLFQKRDLSSAKV
jgi:hypothetical protein